MRPDPFAPVVALDIDGTSGDYHGHFTWFAELYVGRPMPSPTQFTGGVHFSKHLGVSMSTYNAMKLAYRQGGFKRSMPAYDGIGAFTKHVRASGVQVWICTTRPYLRLDNIDPDTRHWLRRNGLQYDAVLYGPHKYRDLVRAVGAGRVLCVFDDLPKMIAQARSLDLRAYMRAQPYNGSSGIATVVRSVDDMFLVFDEELRQWKESNG